MYHLTREQQTIRAAMRAISTRITDIVLERDGYDMRKVCELRDLYHALESYFMELPDFAC